MFHDDLIGWTTMSRIQSIPYTIPFVNRYVTCPRFDRRYPNTSFNLVTGRSLYSYRNAWSRDQTLGHIELIMMMHYRVGQRYLSVIRSDKYQSRFVPTQQTLSEIPVEHLYSHPVTLWRLVHPKHSYGIRSYTFSWSKEMILDIGKAPANELHDLVLCLGLSLVHHIILLMMWSCYQMRTHVHGYVSWPWTMSCYLINEITSLVEWSDWHDPFH